MKTRRNQSKNPSISLRDLSSLCLGEQWQGSEATTYSQPSPPSEHICYNIIWMSHSSAVSFAKQIRYSVLLRKLNKRVGKWLWSGYFKKNQFPLSIYLGLPVTRSSSCFYQRDQNITLSYPNTFMALTKEYGRSDILPHLLPSPIPVLRVGEILVFNQRLYFSSCTKEFNWDFTTKYNMSQSWYQS